MHAYMYSSRLLIAHASTQLCSSTLIHRVMVAHHTLRLLVHAQYAYMHILHGCSLHRHVHSPCSACRYVHRSWLLIAHTCLQFTLNALTIGLVLIAWFNTCVWVGVRPGCESYGYAQCTYTYIVHGCSSHMHVHSYAQRAYMHTVHICSLHRHVHNPRWACRCMHTARSCSLNRHIHSSCSTRLYNIIHNHGYSLPVHGHSNGSVHLYVHSLWLLITSA